MAGEYIKHILGHSIKSMRYIYNEDLPRIGKVIIERIRKLVSRGSLDNPFSIQGSFPNKMPLKYRESLDDYISFLVEKKYLIREVYQGMEFRMPSVSKVIREGDYLYYMNMNKPLNKYED
jgi:hypothetical protein